MTSPPAPPAQLGDILRGAAEGSYPPVDGAVEVVPAMPGAVEAIVSFTGHVVIATALSRDRLLALGADGYGGAHGSAVSAAMASPDGEIGVLDVVLVHLGTGRTVLPERIDLEDHPRVRFARRWRSGVQVHGDHRGLVTIGTGVGGLPEVSVEVDPARRGLGHGRALLTDARGLVPDGEPLLACVAPGNAASLRAALAAGFVPIGAVQLVRPGASRPA